jgi:hypothetical protein
MLRADWYRTVPPARPIETTSSDDRTSDSSVRRVRPKPYHLLAGFTHIAPGRNAPLTVPAVVSPVRRDTNMTMNALVKHIRDTRASETFGFALKVIGIGLFAGLTITYCQFLIDACFKGLH